MRGRFLKWFSGSKGKGAGYSLMSLGNFLAALLTYLRQAEIARLFGTSWQTDAYAVALVFPVLTREVISHSIGATFLPVYADVRERRGPEAARTLVNRILTWTVIAGVLLGGLLAVFSRQLVYAAGPGLWSGGRDLASEMLLIMVPILVLSTLSGVLQGLCNFQRRYGLTSVLRVIEVLISFLMVVVLSGPIGIMSLPVSVLCGSAAMFLTLTVFAWKLHHRYTPEFNPVDPDFIRQIRMAVPIIGGTLVGFLAPVADKILASFLRESSVTALEYANRIVKILFSVLLLPISTLANVSLSALSAKRDEGAFRRELKTLLNWNSSMMIPGTVVLMTLSVPIVSLLFQRGQFSAGDSEMVGYALFFYAPWLASFSLGSILNRAFYSRGDTLTPVLVGIWGMVANVLLNIILVVPMGIGGLALATSATSWTKVVILLYLLRKKTGGFMGAEIFREHMKIFLGAGIMAAVILALRQFIPFEFEGGFREGLPVIAVYLGSGALVYIAVMIAVGSDAARGVMKRFRNHRSGEL